MADSEDEQCCHGIVQIRAASAVELCNTSKGEAKGDVLDEIRMAASPYQNRIGARLRGSGLVLCHATVLEPKECVGVDSSQGR